MRHYPVYSSFRQMIKKCGYILLLGICLLTPNLVKAQEPDPLEVALKLQDTYEKALSLVADFNQTTTMKFSSRIRQGSGTMIFRKPGRMRWDYLTPDYQVLISDGKTISMYFEKNQQMIVTNAKDYLQSDVTYSFFAGTGNILKDFDVSESDIYPELDNFYLIKMTPKSVHPQVSSLYLWISRDTFLITHMQIIDHFDTVTDLFFDNIKINADHYGERQITDDLFLFRPPDGTEIIEQ
jgi:outer membrane lipoprotein carrier protein